MQPTRILPDLQSALVCEDVRQEASGNFLLVGILGIVRVPRVPVTAFKLFLFSRWTAGFGEFRECSRILAPDQTTVLRKSEVRFTLESASHHATNVTLFNQVEFPEAGDYSIEIEVDDVMKLRIPLPVVVVQPPGQEKVAEGDSPPG